jgi:CRISPR-associated protein Cmr2
MKYTGITIGPVTQLLQQCRKTRHVWGTSYLLSYLMKKVLVCLEKEKPGILETHLLIPSITNEQVKGAGITPDNIVLQNPDEIALFPMVTKAIEAAKENVCALLNEQQKIYFLRVIKIYAVEIIAATDNPVGEINSLLHRLDLQMEFDSALYEDNIEWTDIIDVLNGKEFFRAAQTGVPFLSLNLIATTPLNHLATYNINKYSDEDEQDEFYDKLRVEMKEGGGKMNNFYKYMAVVVADGDKVSATISKAGTNAAIVKELAKVFTQFAIKATNAIYRYGGLPVYAGGDDVKFFAPVAVPEGNGFSTVFKLTEDINTLFNNELAGSVALNKFYSENNTLGRPTLSLGIHISYYKYPLYEAINQAEENLKNAKEEFGGNTTFFTLRKHSGHHFGTALERKHTQLNNLMSGLVKMIEPDTLFTSSIMHRMRLYRKLFDAIQYDEEKIKQFILNSYDEDIHHINRNFLDNVAAAIVTSAQVYAPAETMLLTEKEPFYEPKPTDDYLNKIYSVLRFVHFINDTEDER